MSNYQRGTVVLSIDDGRKDAYRLFQEILERYSLPATFNIVTSRIDASENASSETITRAELEALSASPLVEIAAHGHTHQNTEEDILQNKAIFQEWFGLSEPIGFASPGSNMTCAFVENNESKLRDMGLLYVRSARRGGKLSKRHKAVQERARAQGFGEYVVQNAAEFIYGFDSMFVNSVVVFHNTEVEALKRLVDLAVEEKACIVFMFHSVRKRGEEGYDSLWSYDFEAFHDFAEYLFALKRDNFADVVTTQTAYLQGRCAFSKGDDCKMDRVYRL